MFVIDIVVMTSHSRFMCDVISQGRIQAQKIPKGTELIEKLDCESTAHKQTGSIFARRLSLFVFEGILLHRNKNF